MGIANGSPHGPEENGKCTDRARHAFPVNLLESCPYQGPDAKGCHPATPLTEWFVILVVRGIMEQPR